MDPEFDFKLDTDYKKKPGGRPRVVVCIPAFNEEMSIAIVILKAQEFADEILVCDDGSVDMTKEIAQKLGAEVIVNDKNQGKGAALTTLFRRAKLLNSDVIVTIDADGQHDANQISRLIEPIINNKADVVIGSRFVEGSWTDAPLYRRVGLAVINWIYRIKYKGLVSDTQSGFRAYSTEALDVIIDSESKGYGIESEQLNKAIENGLRIMEVPVSIRYKGLGKVSKKNPVLHGAELMAFAMKSVIEKRPFTVFGLPGLGLITAGLVFGFNLIISFNSSQQFNVELTLFTFLSLIIGMMLLIAALAFYCIFNLKSELKGLGSKYNEGSDPSSNI
ncbi:MAG: glycosyltransferase family 2 protein [Candidatus Methanomethylicus sp.]|nr:glycosyltransferase family 2 protein [Candidatus Methanomethylicus sp.]